MWVDCADVGLVSEEFGQAREVRNAGFNIGDSVLGRFLKYPWISKARPADLPEVHPPFGNSLLGNSRIRKARAEGDGYLDPLFCGCG